MFFPVLSWHPEVSWAATSLYSGVQVKKDERSVPPRAERRHWPRVSPSSCSPGHHPRGSSVSNSVCKPTGQLQEGIRSPVWVCVFLFNICPELLKSPTVNFSFLCPCRVHRSRSKSTCKQMRIAAPLNLSLPVTERPAPNAPGTTMYRTRLHLVLKTHRCQRCQTWSQI